ncbi:S24 family peptidase [Comamonas sp. CMM01]|uniref:S24 family peptidase n=1 Tax=Comamonas sp. CMM01 TaxID=2769280 RepID=UPI001783D731|nr:S24 family peptidase [Comamonas sp. CMM01]MBD9530435.1 S24 family peptidase [Comamonas sp. CMM01]
MDDLTQHRKARLRALIDSPTYKGSQAAFANACGLTEGRVSQLLKPDQSFGERSAKNIANELRLGDRYFEEGFAAPQEVSESNVAPAAELKRARRVPVTGSVKGGDDGYLVQDNGIDGWVDYWTTDPHAHALRIKGDSMHPRYRAGEFVIVTPSVEAQPGRDVVVKLTNGKCLLKQLNWMRDDEVQLLSINNGYAPMTIPRSEIETIARVAGSVGPDSLEF